MRYGPSTADVVLAYKRKRNIINYSYQTTADNIVGKMTMAALDKEMLAREINPPPPPRPKGGVFGATFDATFRALADPCGKHAGSIRCARLSCCLAGDAENEGPKRSLPATRDNRWGLARCGRHSQANQPVEHSP